VIRVDRFLISDRPYAIDLDTLTVHESVGARGPYFTGGAEAVWFRRRRGLTVAVAGRLGGFGMTTAPADARDFFVKSTDGRYGGAAAARWDGSNLWAPQMHRDDQEAYYALLAPMLDAFPAIPDGFDGWWTFNTGAGS
jgi:hypothetical protein